MNDNPPPAFFVPDDKRFFISRGKLFLNLKNLKNLKTLKTLKTLKICTSPNTLIG